MKVLVTGSSGLVGTALIPELLRKGHTCVRLVRRDGEGPEEFQWDPDSESIDVTAFRGVECVVHLAGASIAQRWTAAAKSQIVRSRVQGTRFLCKVLASLPHPRPTLISASGVGFYGQRWDSPVGEEGERGKGFLADVAAQWEAATLPAVEAGLRVAHIRLGMVLGATGGALPKMLPPFKLGLGCVLGDGTQYMSWIALDDATGAICHIMATPSLSGPVNLASPNPVRNREFAQRLGEILHRPVFLKAPAFILQAVLGEMASGMLLASTAAIPSKLTESGYVFRYPDLDGALLHILKPRNAGQG